VEGASVKLEINAPLVGRYRIYGTAVGEGDIEVTATYRPGPDESVGCPNL